MYQLLVIGAPSVPFCAPRCMDRGSVVMTQSNFSLSNLILKKHTNYLALQHEQWSQQHGSFTLCPATSTFTLLSLPRFVATRDSHPPSHISFPSNHTCTIFIANLCIQKK